jgi:predicted RecA/RadA family phage recombinase
MSFFHGDPVFEDYQTAAAIAAGDVIVTSSTPRVAHHDFNAGDLASLAAIGGVYQTICDVATGADVKVYWDPVAKGVTATAGTLKVFGVSVTATTGPLQVMVVRHDPGA